MKFEIHITGEESIIDEFKKLDIKTIGVALLTPTHETLRTEFMSSYVIEESCYSECKKKVDDVVAIIEKSNTKIYRVKIETPFKPSVVASAVYIESHFLHEEGSVYPASKNICSGKIICTDRCYDRDFFPMFALKWRSAEVELCLYDDYIREDFDWFKLYNQ